MLVLGSLLLGATVGRRLPDRAVPWLNRWVIDVALPALVLLRIPELSPDPALLAPALTPWARMLGAALLFPPLGRRLGWPRPVIGCLVLTAGLANTSFVGLPLLGALLGPESLGPAVVADQLGSFLALSTVGAVLAATYAGASADPAAILRKLARFPPMLALPVAFAVGALGGWPAPVTPVLGALAATLTPVGLFVVGRQVRPAVPQWARLPLAAGLGWALLFAPLLAQGALWLFGQRGLTAEVAVLQVGMAPMVTAGILAQDHDLAPELATAMVGVGLVLSLVTVPLWSFVV